MGKGLSLPAAKTLPLAGHKPSLWELTFVGVRNCPEKAALLEQPGFRIETLPTASLTYDCERHLDFLTAVSEGRPPSQSLYWQYHELLGRPASWIEERGRRFDALYRSIESKGYDTSQGYISVTEDGIRLNGSHRAAVVHQLGLEAVPVAVYSWDAVGHSLQVHRMLREAASKRELRAAVSGKSAFIKHSGEPLGKVILADIIWQRRSFWRFHWARPQRIYAVEKNSRSIGYYREESVCLSP